MKPINENQLIAGIAEVLGRQIKEIADEEAKKAAAAVEERIRGKVGEIIARVSTYFTYERNGMDLVITVKFPKEKETS